MLSNDQVVHDLAMVYINNRYGAELRGTFSLNTLNGEVSGSGELSTARLPSASEKLVVRVKTGEKRFLGLVDKTVPIESGYEVDPVLQGIVADYRTASSKIWALLQASSQMDRPQ